jgi:hypothetical protein
MELLYGFAYAIPLKTLLCQDVLVQQQDPGYSIKIWRSESVSQLFLWSGLPNLKRKAGQLSALNQERQITDTSFVDDGKQLALRFKTLYALTILECRFRL